MFFCGRDEPFFFIRHRIMANKKEEVAMEKQAQLREYIDQMAEWAKQLEAWWRGHDDPDIHYDFNRLWSRLEEQEEWTDVEVYELQGMATQLYEKTVRLIQEQPLDSVADRENEMEEQREARVPIGRHQLPPLPYRYDALEPHISEEIMRLHHTKHHQSYVDGLNQAEKMMQKARETNQYGLLKHWEREAAFHGSGHYLHTIFWNNLTPNGGGNPHGRLLEQIKEDFGSVERFKRHFTEAAKSVEGVGWAILVWAPRPGRLEILHTEKHQFMTQWDTIPLLVLDVWEHAYYLQYKNDRSAYIESFWKIVNWRDVEERFVQASRLRWKPF